jgi:hypothetical protein
MNKGAWVNDFKPIRYRTCTVKGMNLSGVLDLSGGSWTSPVFFSNSDFEFLPKIKVIYNLVQRPIVEH